MGARIFLGYSLIVGLAVYFLMNVFVQEIKPGVRMSAEETLIDTANLLAELARDEVKAGTIQTGGTGAWRRAIEAQAHRHIGARISGFAKDGSDLRIYVTDERGVVIYDSTGRDVGADYSRWNDVARTLRGKYGARSTRAVPDNELTSVMHVAAPVLDEGRIIGVLTVAKPNVRVQPFIEAGRRQMLRAGVLLALLSLGVGLVFSGWLSRSVRQVVRYAQGLSEGRRVPPPSLGAELGELVRAVTHLRAELHGKAYVEEYVLALTHELKSPLAAIRGAGELLEEDVPPEDRARFLANIRAESERLRRIVDRMLELARVEQLGELEHRAPVNLAALVDDLGAAREPALRAGDITAVVTLAPPAQVEGDAFLLGQAIGNLVDNAIDFCDRGGRVTIDGMVDGTDYVLRVHDTGAPIPEFAAPHLFERFYSLPRPGTQRKSTGLGLSLVREVAALHSGEVHVANSQGGGVTAELRIPVNTG